MLSIAFARDMSGSALPNTFRLTNVGAITFTDCCGPLRCSPLLQGLLTLRLARLDLSFRLESATGRSGAYPGRTYTC